MIEVTILDFWNYLLLGEIAKLTPKIPLQTDIFLSNNERYVTYQIDGLSSEDAMYIILKYNGKKVQYVCLDIN